MTVHLFDAGLRVHMPDHGPGFRAGRGEQADASAERDSALAPQAGSWPTSPAKEAAFGPPLPFRLAGAIEGPSPASRQPFTEDGHDPRLALHDPGEADTAFRDLAPGPVPAARHPGRGCTGGLGRALRPFRSPCPDPCPRTNCRPRRAKDARFRLPFLRMPADAPAAGLMPWSFTQCLSRGKSGRTVVIATRSEGPAGRGLQRCPVRHPSSASGSSSFAGIEETSPGLPPRREPFAAYRSAHGFGARTCREHAGANSRRKH